MNGRKATKNEQLWMDKICQLGCIVCKLHHQTWSPGSPHHIDGARKPGAHFKTICLCHVHHQADDSNQKYESVHGNKARFEKRYGTQLELLEKTKEAVLWA